MLAHASLDQLNAFSLHRIAEGFKELEHKTKPATSTMQNGSACCSTTKPRYDGRSGSRRARAPHVCGISLVSRTWTTRRRVGSIAPCS